MKVGENSFESSGFRVEEEENPSIAGCIVAGSRAGALDEEIMPVASVVAHPPPDRA